MEKTENGKSDDSILLTTTEAAAMLRRAPQTLRAWACHGNGPIMPVPFSRRGPLMWRRSDVEKTMMEKFKNYRKDKQPTQLETRETHCPFCRVGDFISYKHDDIYDTYWMECDCGARGPVAGTKSDAAEEWEKRFNHPKHKVEYIDFLEEV